MSLFVRNRTMLDAARHDEHLAGPYADIAFSHLNRDPAFQNQEEIVRPLMLMPGEWTFDLYHHDVVSIELGHGSGLVMLCESR
jgi:hypothetical protein